MNYAEPYDPPRLSGTFTQIIDKLHALHWRLGRLELRETQLVPIPLNQGISCEFHDCTT